MNWDQKAKYLSSVLAVIAVVVAEAPAASPACSKRDLPFHGSGPMFIGTATGDTVAAGSGGVKYRIAGGHFGRGVERAFYGQVVQVEKLGATLRTSLRSVLSKEPNQVILVPWDYAADCNPVPWSRSARWVESGDRGLFFGSLRDTAHWVGGLPTFDVHTPQSVPYPTAPGYRRMGRGERRSTSPGDSTLTPDELLSLYDVLAEEKADRADTGRSIVARLQKWARDYPHLAPKYPARQLISSALRGVESSRVRAISSPLAGTYRFNYKFSSGDSLTLFARTVERPTTLLWSITGQEEATNSSTALPRAEGYYLPAQVDTSLAGIVARTATSIGIARQGYVAVVEQPAFSDRDSSMWLGSVDLARAAGSFAADTALRATLKALDQIMYAMYEEGTLTFAPGRFVRRRDGSVRFEMDVKRNGELIFSVRGERISAEQFPGR